METKTAPIARPLFNISCEGEQRKPTDLEDYVPADTDILYLDVSTAKNKWHCRCRRNAFNKVFESIQELGVTIEF